MTLPPTKTVTKRPGRAALRRRAYRQRKQATMEQLVPTIDILKEAFPVFAQKKLLAIKTSDRIKKTYWKQGVHIKHFPLHEILTAHVAQDWYQQLVSEEAPRYQLDGITIQATQVVDGRRVAIKEEDCDMITA